MTLIDEVRASAFTSRTDDGTRSLPALRRDMLHFQATDEVDMVVVGCGAGGGCQSLGQHDN